MTRQAVREGFEEFTSEMIQVAYDEFDVVGAIRGGMRGGPGSGVTNKLLKNNDAVHRKVVRPELGRYQRRILQQFDTVLDYAEDPDATPAGYRDAILRSDMYDDALKQSVAADRRRELRDALVERAVSMADAAEPLVRSPADDFWAAVQQELTYAQASELVGTHFTFTEPVRGEEDAFAFAVEIEPADVLGGGLGSLLGGGLPSVEVDFTEEALRVMQRAEAAVVDQATREVDRRFDEGAVGEGAQAE
jgi:hypothetical protein